MVVDCDVAVVSALVAGDCSPKEDWTIPHETKSAAAANPNEGIDFPLTIPFTVESVFKPI